MEVFKRKVAGPSASASAARRDYIHPQEKVDGPAGVYTLSLPLPLAADK
jgi:hypothetical protein